MHSTARLQARPLQIAMPASAGEMLFLEGEPCEHVYELRKGIARGVSISQEGDRQVTAFFFAGDQIGLPVSDHYRFTAEAVTDVLYVRHSRTRWHEALIRSCREEGRLLPSICAEQDPVFRRGMILGRNGILLRTCAFLISIIDRLPLDEDRMPVLPMPQIDIAAYLATSPESVCRAFRQLRELGAVATSRRDQLVIADRPAIALIASGVPNHPPENEPAAREGNRRR
jgi:CRP-like cAMP-binding protein